jgi:hypothetical protein
LFIHANLEILGDPRVDDPYTTLEAVVEVTLSSATSKNLGLDDHVVALCTVLATAHSLYSVHISRTNGLGYLLSLLCVVSDIALSDLDSVLGDWSVPVFSPSSSCKQAYRVEELRGAPLVDRKVAALLESRLSDRSALEDLG